MADFLVTFSDVIDEVIEVHGFKIMNEKEVLQFEELANSITWPFTYDFEDGTELYYSNGESFLSSVTFKEITTEQGKTFFSLFPKSEFGFFIGEDFLKQIIEGEDDDDDFDEDDENTDNDYYHDY